jgi:3-hydroxybutyryl-CoA dehydratase
MLSKSLKWKINTKDIENFGLIVGDHNPVHRDPTFAAKTRFKTPIAHGMVSITLLNQLIPSIFNIKSLSVRFVKPIYPQYELTATLNI